VVHANGDVGLCEQRPPIGNLRKNSFMEIWQSAVATDIRDSIRKKECYCTNEIFMWPSIVFQPRHLLKSMVGARVWEQVEPLPESERVDYSAKTKSLEGPELSRKARSEQLTQLALNEAEAVKARGG